MRSLPLNEEMLRLKRKALEREEKLGDTANDGDETGAAVDEHSDTWGFSWMPAIEDFVELASAQTREADGNGGGGGGDEGSTGREELASGDHEDSTEATGGNFSGDYDGDESTTQGERCSGGFEQVAGRKRRRPPTDASSRRQPSYNETLLADKAFHNPRGSETMAEAFRVVHPLSFVLDVEADDRTWGGGAAAGAATPVKGEPREALAGEGAEKGAKPKLDDGGGGEYHRNWFYDTVRDRQNRLWADTRVKRGVEIARKGQHQEAIDVYTQALGMCPDHEDGLVARGAAFATTGRLRQAAQDLSRALSLNPRNENASSYLKETRRRMDRQDTKLSPAPTTSSSGTTRGMAYDIFPAHASTVGKGSSCLHENADGSDDGSRSALAALMQDGAEGGALRKMRVLLEEDERKRKRDRKSSSATAAGSEDSGHNKKRPHKKNKKSKSYRNSSRSSHRKRDRDRRRASSSVAGDAAVSDGDNSSTGSSADDGGDGGRRSSSSNKKKRKKRSNRKKKRSSRARSMSPPCSTGGLVAAVRGGRGGSGGSSDTDEDRGDSGGESPSTHPILQRKKHSLWGM